jgi:transposase
VLTLNPLDLFPSATELGLRQVILDDGIVSFVVRTIAPAARCPTCGGASSRVHSRYRRGLAGLPWNGHRLRLELSVRRFVCQAPDCPRRIFAERLPDLATPFARSTSDLHATHTQIGASAGGEGGSRLAGRLAIPTSPDTLLRRVRQAALRPGAPVRVLGVDDWAFRKGHRYGTILVDLEQRRPIDLLPERSAEALCAWLQQHPEVEIITRDRGDDMIRGATAGAPQATQVADRWHLLRNLLDALKGTVDRHHTDVKNAAHELASERSAAATSEVLPSTVGDPVAHPAASTVQPRLPEEQQVRRARRVERYEQVQELHRQGLSKRQVARRLGLHRDTVARLVDAVEFPERALRNCRRRTDQFAEHLQRRWAEGRRNAAALFEELKE